MQGRKCDVVGGTDNLDDNNNGIWNVNKILTMPWRKMFCIHLCTHHANLPKYIYIQLLENNNRTDSIFNIIVQKYFKCNFHLDGSDLNLGCHIKDWGSLVHQHINIRKARICLVTRKLRAHLRYIFILIPWSFWIKALYNAMIHWHWKHANWKISESKMIKWK